MIYCSDIDIKPNIDHHYSSKPSRRNEIEFRLTHNSSFSLAAKNSIFGLEQKKMPEIGAGKGLNSLSFKLFRAKRMELKQWMGS